MDLKSPPSLSLLSLSPPSPSLFSLSLSPPPLPLSLLSLSLSFSLSPPYLAFSQTDLITISQWVQRNAEPFLFIPLEKLLLGDSFGPVFSQRNWFGRIAEISTVDQTL